VQSKIRRDRAFKRFGAIFNLSPENSCRPNPLVTPIAFALKTNVECTYCSPSYLGIHDEKPAGTLKVLKGDFPILFSHSSAKADEAKYK